MMTRVRPWLEQDWEELSTRIWTHCQELSLVLAEESRKEIQEHEEGGVNDRERDIKSFKLIRNPEESDISQDSQEVLRCSGVT